MFLILALVYSGQDEIIRGIKKAFSLWVDISTLDEKSFRQFLDTASFPPVDLIIRTWWDIRHSWYLLYDSAYSEYAFTSTLFPDFSKEEFEKILEKFWHTERRFGK
jgi:undecaprenyl diphosphate synthase